MTVLTAVLTYHVLEESVVIPASQIVSSDMMIETLQGSLLAINATTLIINGGANIIKPDALLANNGIVHVIDAVLVPDTVLPFIEQCIADATRAPVVAAPKGTSTPTTAPPAPSSTVGWSIVTTAVVLLLASIALQG